MSQINFHINPGPLKYNIGDDVSGFLKADTKDYLVAQGYIDTDGKLLKDIGSDQIVTFGGQYNAKTGLYIQDADGDGDGFLWVDEDNDGVISKNELFIVDVGDHGILISGDAGLYTSNATSLQTSNNSFSYLDATNVASVQTAQGVKTTYTLEGKIEFGMKYNDPEAAIEFCNKKDGYLSPFSGSGSNNIVLSDGALTLFSNNSMGNIKDLTGGNGVIPLFIDGGTYLSKGLGLLFLTEGVDTNDLQDGFIGMATFDSPVQNADGEYEISANGLYEVHYDSSTNTLSFVCGEDGKNGVKAEIKLPSNSLSLTLPFNNTTPIVPPGQTYDFSADITTSGFQKTPSSVSQPVTSGSTSKAAQKTPQEITNEFIVTGDYKGLAKYIMSRITSNDAYDGSNYNFDKDLAPDLDFLSDFFEDGFIEYNGTKYTSAEFQLALKEEVDLNTVDVDTIDGRASYLVEGMWTKDNWLK